jgi:hypothetical protein
MDDLDSKIRTVVRQMGKHSNQPTPTNLTIQVPKTITPTGFNNSKDPVKHHTDMVSSLTQATLPAITAKQKVKNPLAPDHDGETDVVLEIPGSDNSKNNI